MSFFLSLGFFGIHNISHFINKGFLETVKKCISLIMGYARHTIFKDAKLYIQDIAHRLARAQNLCITRNEVCNWTPINICYDSACNQPGFRETHHLLGTILEVCNKYVTVYLNIDDIQNYTYNELLEKAENNWLAANKPMVHFNQNYSSGRGSMALLCQWCQSVPLISRSVGDYTTNNIPPTVWVLTNITNTTTKSDNFYMLFHKFQGLRGKDRRTLAEKVRIICDVYNKRCVSKQMKLEADSYCYFYHHESSVIGKCVKKCYRGNIIHFVDNLPGKKVNFNISAKNLAAVRYIK